MSTLKLPIRTREVFSGDHGHEQIETVFCPDHRSAPVEDCKICPFARSVEKDAVICVRGPAPHAEKFAIGRDPNVDIAAAAARTLVREILPRDVTCVRGDVSVEMCAALLVERGLLCLPVIDADDKLIGILSKSDLLLNQVQPNEPLAKRTVSEIMTPCVHALPDDAPVAFAISLMAFESLHEVPIVSNEGRVVGVATTLDLLRWLAARMGYVLAPERH